VCRLRRFACLFPGSQGLRQVAPHLATLTPGLVFATTAALTRAPSPRPSMPQPKSWSHAGNRRACGDSVRSAARRPAGRRARRGARARCARYDRQVPVHVRVHKQPKGVITNHRMLCANQQMIRQTFSFLALEPPILVDWLPWNHTFGGSHNVGIALVNGGTLYIDDGRPTHKALARRCAICARSHPASTSTCPRDSRRSRPRWKATIG